MKKAMILVLATLTVVAGHAQKNNFKVTGAYGGGTAELNFVNGKPALAIGGYGGILLGKKMMIGVGGNNLFFTSKSNGKSIDQQFNYYGLYSEYYVVKSDNINLFIATLSGIGWLENEEDSPKNRMRKDGKFTWVAQPRLGTQVKITSFMRATAYAGYRITGNTESTNYSEKNLNGISLGAGLIFGKF